ncbi:PAS domain-containing sensor histidine kinase [Psychromonas sp. psych-6C06]|uniref:sensor histidine kinase n=1 Tax=Psychromonas sp. psych-6C06 TaxID=2058089 RepID=UPI000C33B273|nr:ATP-binding protein [Psychromonas sp. psych-6C06]PKF62889.1 PAS domain-containing sensor histidine kinase [Psychromonas sp. psych-6C06]
MTNYKPNLTSHNETSDLEQESFAGELTQLRAQAAYMDQLYSELPSGLIVIDGNGVIEQANRVALSLLGEPLEGLLWSDIIERSFSPKSDDGHEISLKNGRRIQLSISSLNGQPGQLILLTDLTSTRQLQEHVAKLQRLSSLGKMVASLAHQIRTPLSAAMLYGANLANKTLNESSRSRFQGKLMNRLNDLETQVNDMLLFARSGNQKIIDEVSLVSLLEEVQDASETLLQQVGGHLQCRLPDPDLLIMANKSALASAMTNLISNAVEATGKGAQLYISTQRRGNDSVEISVMDNGPGIEKEDLAKVMEAFYTTKSQGTGLGLAVVQSIAQAHKGSVEVKSEFGKGSCFTMVLPLHRVGEYRGVALNQAVGG